MYEKIDFVIPWVDGGDPAWLKEKNMYSEQKSGADDGREIRFRDWDTLKYVFRGIEKYAPWVNKVHFITWGHLPPWLDAQHPKLNIVHHRDYIPSQYLPTFSSHTIELNLHRIPGLAEHFVYFNDDIFILKQLKETDFFKNGIPCDLCVPNAITPRLGEFSPILLNTTSVINKHFSKRESLKKHLGKWISPRYGKLLLRTICLMPWTFHTGFFNHHLAIPYRKKTLEEVWQKEPEVLDSTCRHRFRNDADVNQYIFRYWRLAAGEFVPHRVLGKYANISQDNTGIFRTIRKQKAKLFCINDKDGEIDFETVQGELVREFESIFPEKSSFECESYV